MKIAVAFTGAIRTERTWKNIKKFFEYCVKYANIKDCQIDYFLYTSDKVDIHGTSFGRAKTLSPDYQQSENLTMDRVNNFIEFFSPVKVLIEPNKDCADKLKKVSEKANLTEEEHKIVCYNDNFIVSQMLKAETVVKLIQEYEEEHKFEYDVIYRTRLDVFYDFDETSLKNNTVKFEKEFKMRFNSFIDFLSDKEVNINSTLLGGVIKEIPFFVVYVQNIHTDLGSVQHDDWYIFGSGHALKLYYNNLSFNIFEFFRQSFDLIYKHFDYNKVKDMDFVKLKDYVWNNMYDLTKPTSFEYLHLKTFFGNNESLWVMSSYKSNLVCTQGWLDSKLHRPGFPYPDGIEIPDNNNSFLNHHATDLDYENHFKALASGDIEKYDPEKSIGYFKT